MSDNLRQKSCLPARINVRTGEKGQAGFGIILPDKMIFLKFEFGRDVEDFVSLADLV